MTDQEVKIGDHCWALSDGDLLVVLKDEEGRYQVCGAWECGIPVDELELLEVIPRPQGFEALRLYYLDDQ